MKRKSAAIALAIGLAIGFPSVAKADINELHSVDGCSWRSENYRPYGLYFARTTGYSSVCLQECVRVGGLNWACGTTGAVEVWGEGPWSTSSHKEYTFSASSTASYFFS